MGPPTPVPGITHRGWWPCHLVVPLQPQWATGTLVRPSITRQKSKTCVRPWFPILFMALLGGRQTAQTLGWALTKTVTGAVPGLPLPWEASASLVLNTLFILGQPGRELLSRPTTRPAAITEPRQSRCGRGFLSYQLLRFLICETNS